MKKDELDWNLPEFKGRCMGVRLVPRDANDPHVCFELLTEDDGFWLSGVSCPSSYWLPDLIQVLSKARTWMNKNCVKTEYGWDFKPEWLAALQRDISQ